MAPKPALERLALGYIGGVTVATLTYVAVGFVLPRAGMDIISLLRPDRLSVLVVLGVGVGIVTAFAALLPCLAAEALAAVLPNRPAWYFASWGAMTGLVLGPCVTALHTGFATDGGSPLPALWADRYVMELPHVGPPFTLSGIMGGLAYWWLSSRSVAASRPHMSP